MLPGGYPTHPRGLKSEQNEQWSLYLLLLNAPFVNRESVSPSQNFESEARGPGLTLYEDDILVPATGSTARPGPLQVSEWSQSVSGLQTRASSVTSTGQWSPPGYWHHITDNRQWQWGVIEGSEGTRVASIPGSQSTGWSPTPTLTPGVVTPRPLLLTPLCPLPPTQSTTPRGELSTCQHVIIHISCGLALVCSAKSSINKINLPEFYYFLLPSRMAHYHGVSEARGAFPFQSWHFPIYIHSKRLGNRMAAVCDRGLVI